ncbi:MAG TPA: hypothetical protein VKX45_24015 [Bryobacteraceae bacterium]|nr:hypothetical protein [Bryobacteraceae bacterium]
MQLVTEILQSYADRGIFRGFSAGPVRNGKATYKLVWFRNREYEITADTRKGVIRCPVVLPQVPPEIYAKLKLFIQSRHTEEVQTHRRIDPAKARANCAIRAGNVSVTVTVTDDDYEYATRRFVNLLHEIFLVFLQEHFDYQVAAYDLDPDNPL